MCFVSIGSIKIIKYNLNKYKNVENVENKKDNKKDEEDIEQITNQYKKISRTKVHKILKHFVTNGQEKEEVISKTDVLCWHCCHPFDNEPIPCPFNYDEIRDRFEVKGNFCSWSCASAYSIDVYKSLTYIYILKRKFDPDTFEPEMIVAPSRFCLKAFGGPLSINEFRSYQKDPLKKDHIIKLSTDYISYVNQEILETYVELKKI